MKPKKQARPELQWPWCDACQSHVKQTNGIAHDCIPNTSTWRLMTDPHATRLLSVRARLGDLNADELEAFDTMLAKLEQGKRDHGPLDLASDRRDFYAEGQEEMRDWLWYHAFREVLIRRPRVDVVGLSESDRAGLAAGLRELAENAP